MLLMSLTPSDNRIKSRFTGHADILSSILVPKRSHYDHNHHHPNDQKQEQRLIYRLLKRQWSANKSPVNDYKSHTCSLHRRLSSPALDNTDSNMEMTMLVKNNTSSASRAPKRSLSLMFWRTGGYEDNVDLCTLLQKIDITCAKDIANFSEIVKRRITKKNLSPTGAAEYIQSIYQALQLRLRRGITFQDLTESRAESVMKTFEEFFMRNIYDDIFTQISIEERSADNALSERIESLHWVEPSHLAAKIDVTDARVTELLDKAILDLTAMTFMESAVEKLCSIMNCSKRIFQLLRLRKDATESADDFLPMMVYIVLQSNPPLLQSNIRYILQFGNSEKFMTGEEGYYFTHLCSAVSFIENISGRSLGITEEEFQRLLKEESDESQASHLSKHPSRRRLSQYVCKAYHRAAEIRAAQQRQETLRERSTSLQAEMMQLKTEILSSRSRPSKLKQLEDEGMVCISKNDSEDLSAV